MNFPLRIDTITLPGNHGQIGMTFWSDEKKPGDSSACCGRNFEADLDIISVWGADAVVTLLEEFELDMLGISSMPALLQQRHIEWFHLPIRDKNFPDDVFEEKWLENGRELKTILSNGGKVLFHCSKSLGRTGTIAARLLVEFGYKPSDAIDMLRETNLEIIENAAQEGYVLKLKKPVVNNSIFARSFDATACSF